MTDASGTGQATITYDGFGNVLSNSNSSFTDRYLYTGRELDSVTGLQYNRARYYDPTVGRWTQEDPLGFGGRQENIYQYLRNGAPNATDPTGLADDLFNNKDGASADAIQKLMTDLNIVPIVVTSPPTDFFKHLNKGDRFKWVVSKDGTIRVYPYTPKGPKGQVIHPMLATPPGSPIQGGGRGLVGAKILYLDGISINYDTRKGGGDKRSREKGKKAFEGLNPPFAVNTVDDAEKVK